MVVEGKVFISSAGRTAEKKDCWKRREKIVSKVRVFVINHFPTDQYIIAPTLKHMGIGKKKNKSTS
jgi:ribosomal protein L31E